MPQDLTDDKLTLVQVMAWYSQATSHYLSQCFDPDLCRQMASLGLNELTLLMHACECCGLSLSSILVLRGAYEFMMAWYLIGHV